MPVVENFYGSERIVDSYAPRSEKILWGAQDFLANGLAGDIEEGRATILEQDADGYMLATIPPDGLIDRYYHLIFAFPHKDQDITPNMDALPPLAELATYNSIALAAESIRQFAEERGETIDRVLAVQHIGPSEVEHDHPFATTLPQLHWHVHSYDSDVIGKQFNRVDITPDKRRTMRHILGNPLFPLVRDHAFHEFNHGVRAAEYKPGSSIVLDSLATPTEPFTAVEKDVARRALRVWRETVSDMAICFVDGVSRDSQGRLIPLEAAEIERNVDLYIEKNDFLSTDSQRLLRFLGHAVRRADEVPMTSWFFEGIAGAMSWDFNYRTNERRLVVAPRTIAIPKKHWTVVPPDGDYIIVKDKSTPPDISRDPDRVDMIRHLRAMVAKHGTALRTLHSNHGAIEFGTDAVSKTFKNPEEAAYERKILGWLAINEPDVAPREIEGMSDEPQTLHLQNVGPTWEAKDKHDVAAVIRLMTPMWGKQDYDENMTFRRLLGKEFVAEKTDFFESQYKAHGGHIDPSVHGTLVREVTATVQELAKTNTGVVHHDISPRNLCVDSSGTDRLIDWSGSQFSYPLFELAIVLEKFGYKVGDGGNIALDGEVETALSSLPFYDETKKGLLARAMLSFDIQRNIKGIRGPAYTSAEVASKVRLMRELRLRETQKLSS